MSDWKVITPLATDNMVLNPSMELDADYGVLGGGVASRVATYSWKGNYCARLVTLANNSGMTFALETLPNADHYATMRVRVSTMTAGWDWSLDNITYTTPTLLAQLDDNWALYGCSFPAAEANGSTDILIRQDGVGALTLYLDGIQVEEQSIWTTFCAGDQEGCEWSATPHSSYSSRSEASRAGGLLEDLADDYDCHVAGIVGAGSIERNLFVDEYAILPGGQLAGVHLKSGEFSLIVHLRVPPGGSPTLHEVRNSLLQTLSGSIYPLVNDLPQPIRLVYTGDSTWKQIEAHYMGGLEINWGKREGNQKTEEKVRLGFSAPDPFWRSIGEDSTDLSPRGTITANYMTGRLRSTGLWDDLGIGAPTTFGFIGHIVISPFTGKVYISGDFTGWDGGLGRDYMAVYDPVADSWGTVHGAAAFNGFVYGMDFAPDGTLYIGGAFTNAGGDANADYLCQYDEATNTISAVAAGGTGTVYDVLVAQDGNVYFCGTFLNWNAIANADRAAYWDGTAYNAMGTGLNNNGWTIAQSNRTGLIYMGGDFTTAGAVTAYRLAAWDPSAGSWTVVGTAAATTFNGTVRDIVIAPDGAIYACGGFTNAGGDADADSVAQWNGTAWSSLGSGLNNTAYGMALGPDGVLWIVGLFTIAGGIDVSDRIARWTGKGWSHVDIDLPAAFSVDSVAVGNADPVIQRNYDVFLGSQGTGTAQINASSTVTNDGNTIAYPILTFARDGVDDNVILSVRNETTGQQLFLNYSLLDGEVLTIDLRPGRKEVYSNHYGAMMRALLPVSSLSDFHLLPGDNQITCLVNTSGAAIADTFCLFRDPFEGIDG